MIRTLLLGGFRLCMVEEAMPPARVEPKGMLTMVVLSEFMAPGGMIMLSTGPLCIGSACTMSALKVFARLIVCSGTDDEPGHRGSLDEPRVRLTPRELAAARRDDCF